VDTKFCRDCGFRRPVADFSANRRSRDGLAFYCHDHLAERSARSREKRRNQPQRRRTRPRELHIPAGSKWCPDCGQVKGAAQFPRSRAAASGLGSYCLPCHNERGKRNLENRGGSRTYHLSRRYGISADEAELMLRAQGGLCAICRAAPAAHVDHDHESGRVRELLCFNCNGGLGQFRDDPAVLRAAAEYVERHRGDLGSARPRALVRRRPEVSSRLDRPPVGSQTRRPGVRRTGLWSHGRRPPAAREAGA
jgi:hypothetical protein